MAELDNVVHTSMTFRVDDQRIAEGLRGMTENTKVSVCLSTEIDTSDYESVTCWVDGQRVAVEYSDDMIHWVSAETPGAQHMRYVRPLVPWIVYENVDLGDYDSWNPAWVEGIELPIDGGES